MDLLPRQGTRGPLRLPAVSGPSHAQSRIRDPHGGTPALVCFERAADTRDDTLMSRADNAKKSLHALHAGELGNMLRRANPVGRGTVCSDPIYRVMEPT